MREILFRGKTTKKEQEIHAFHNVWVEGDLIKNGDKWHIHPKSNCFRSEKELAKCMVAHEVIPETVGQFTGLTDNNGKKIFEGDIIKMLPVHCGNLHYELVAIVCFDSGAFSCKEILDRCPSALYMYKKWWRLEVIGNIHDNKELLG